LEDAAGGELVITLGKDRSGSHASSEDDSMVSMKHDDFSVGRLKPSKTCLLGGRHLNSVGRSMSSATGTRIDLIRRNRFEVSSEGDSQKDLAD